ncbi:zinc finger protein CONSTANS-like 16-like [Senna tora]|uniref:Zinc finger protein CONSTANS-like 16-like n=1 Tax=Senna tora TaxID=362788 RepID=A0A834SU00_9FABA|nr:zinc finger protein CONSTANS-like 16-like [Senna tora]
MELAEFAADVESLLGRGLENECIGMEELDPEECWPDHCVKISCKISKILLKDRKTLYQTSLFHVTIFWAPAFVDIKSVMEGHASEEYAENSRIPTKVVNETLRLGIVVRRCEVATIRSSIEISASPLKWRIYGAVNNVNQDEKEEDEIEIGSPTYVKQVAVAHIGMDGPLANAPSLALYGHFTLCGSTIGLDIKPSECQKDY